MEKDELLNFLNENGMTDKDAIKFLYNLKETFKSIEDIPQMKRIQDTINEKTLNMLIDVNGYLIDEMQKVKSNMAKDSIEKLIKNNFKLIVEMIEEKEK